MSDSFKMQIKKEYFVFGSKLYSYILNVVFIVYAFLLPFSKAFPVFTGPYIILLFWLLEGNYRDKLQKIKSNKAIVFLLIFFLLNIISLLWSDNIHEGKQLLRCNFAVTIVLIALFTSMKNKFSIAILYAFLFSMFISEIVSYGIYFELWQIPGTTVSNPTPFMHHTIYSVFLAVTIFLLLGQLTKKEISLKIKIFEMIFFISSSINLFVNGGRTGQLALVFGAIVYTVIYLKKKIYLLYVFVLIVIIFVTAYQFSPNFHNRVLQGKNDIEKIQSGNLKSSWGGRIAIKIVSFDIFKEHPMFGTGIGDTMDTYKAYLEKDELKKFHFTKNMQHLHDQYLEILIQTGIVGLILFGLFIYELFLAAFRTLDRNLSATMSSVLVVFLFSFFTDVPLINFTAGLFAFIFGYMLNKSVTKES